jgi:hypothetical protein
MEGMYEVIAIHPATGEITRFAVAATSHYEARRHAESCGLQHVVVSEPGGEGSADCDATRPFSDHTGKSFSDHTGK